MIPALTTYCLSWVVCLAVFTAIEGRRLLGLGDLSRSMERLAWACAAWLLAPIFPLVLATVLARRIARRRVARGAGACDPWRFPGTNQI